MRLDGPGDVERVAVVGAGEMGSGIAAVTALAGYETVVNDVDAAQLEEALERAEWSYGKLVDRGETDEDDAQAALGRIETTDSLADAVADADVVTEAAVERQDVKTGIFERVDDLAPERTVLTTNTSGLNVTALAEVTGRPSQVLGTHWFNPPMLMELVELVETEHVAESTVSLCEEFVEDLGKTPIRCRRDVPQFVVNRCIRPYCESASWLYHYGEADVEEVDSAMRYGEGFPMGPFELTDFTGGVQIRVESEEDHLNDPRPLSYDTRYSPPLHELYERGHYGRKSGSGFYDYTDRDEADVDPEAGAEFDPLWIWAPVINEAAKMVQHDVATVEDVDTGMRLGGNWPVGPFEKADEVGADAVVRRCVEFADLHEPIENVAEVLPCDLLVSRAKDGGSFR